MDKKNIFKLIAIILIVVGILTIALALITANDNDNNTDNKVDSEDVNNGGGDLDPPPIVSEMTYEDVYSMALSLYGGDNVNIEIEEETERFVIKRIFKSTGAIERYFVDKETGSISTEELIFESEITG